MIITQTRQRRTFVGSLNTGEDLIDSLANICVDNSIFCALFSGIGYIKDPQIRNYNLARKDFDRTTTYPGTFHCISLHGNVSLKDRKTVIHAHVIGTIHRDEAEPRTISGEIMGGKVITFEFSLSSVDDIRLYRAEDDRTGLEPWLHMELGAGPPPPAADDEVPIVGTGPGAEPPSEQVAAPPPVVEDDDDDDEELTDGIEVLIGDWLEHPTLGRCEVTESDSEERVTIRLESGRMVELHLGLLDLSVIGTTDEGNQLIKLAIRRRR